MKKYTKIIADYLSNLKYEDIPGEVIERAKLVTLHTIGAAISAVKTEAGQNIIDVAKTLGAGGREASIWTGRIAAGPGTLRLALCQPALRLLKPIIRAGRNI